jgi:hypothetical protein
VCNLKEAVASEQHEVEEQEDYFLGGFQPA